MTGEYLQPYADHKNLTFDFQIIIQTAKRGLRPTFPTKTPEHWVQCISLCWDSDPLKRPECPQLLEVWCFVVFMIIYFYFFSNYFNFLKNYNLI